LGTDGARSVAIVPRCGARRSAGSWIASSAAGAGAITLDEVSVEPDVVESRRGVSAAQQRSACAWLAPDFDEE